MEKLTATEAREIDVVFNLADAHARQDASDGELARSFGAVSAMHAEAASGKQHELDRRAYRAFMAVSGQSSAADAWFLPVYASSISMEIVANVVRLSGRSAALIEPTFDNLADILKRHRVALTAIPLEGAGGYAEPVMRAVGAGAEVVVLVAPNNPTGHVLDASQLAAIAQCCSRSGTILVLDFSFRLFEDRMLYDQYAILDASGVLYIALEDTGKVWPTLDLKLSYIVASARLRPQIELVYQDFMLNVSPFIDILVERYSNFSRENGFGSFRDVIAVNRGYLRDLLESHFGSSVIPFRDSRVSVEFIKPPLRSPSSDLARVLARHGVAVLSGRPFFWQENSLGERYLRVALSRTPSSFVAAADRLAELLLLHHKGAQL